MEKLPEHLQQMQGTNWLGPHGHVLHYPVRRGEIMNFISFVERDDWQIESWVTQGTQDELANDFRGWHSDVHEIIGRIETPYKWALMVRGPMARWSVGRVTLLGDACHPTLPFLGQGGVMAIEDGYIVAACLAKYFDDPATAFARYEDIRRERTATVVRKGAREPALGVQPGAGRSKRRGRRSGARMAAGARARAHGMALRLRCHRRGGDEPPTCDRTCRRHGRPSSPTAGAIAGHGPRASHHHPRGRLWSRIHAAFAATRGPLHSRIARGDEPARRRLLVPRGEWGNGPMEISHRNHQAASPGQNRNALATMCRRSSRRVRGLPSARWRSALPSMRSMRSGC